MFGTRICPPRFPYPSSRRARVILRRQRIGRRAGLLRAKASIDAGFGGVLFFKAKTDELRKYYMQEFGAMPVGHYDPYRLVIWEDAAANILSDFEEV